MSLQEGLVSPPETLAHSRERHAIHSLFFIFLPSQLFRVRNYSGPILTYRSESGLFAVRPQVLPNGCGFLEADQALRIHINLIELIFINLAKKKY